jgi:beta-glucosidase
MPPSQIVNFVNPASINDIFNQLVALTSSVQSTNEAVNEINASNSLQYANGFPNPDSLPDLSPPAERDPFDGVPDNAKTYIEGLVANMSVLELASNMVSNAYFNVTPLLNNNYGGYPSSPGYDMTSNLNFTNNTFNSPTGSLYGGSGSSRSVVPIMGDHTRGIDSFETANSANHRQEGCTWDPTLLGNYYTRVAQLLNQMGVSTVFGPQADHGADLGHGRSDETFGEDQLLNFRCVESRVQSMQAQQIGATVKHVLEGIEARKSSIDGKRLRESFIAAFKACRDAWFVMIGAYVPVNGVTPNFSPLIIKTIIRQFFQFNGVVMTDALSSFWSSYQGSLVGEEALTLYQINAGIDQFLISYDAFVNGFVPLQQVIVNLVTSGQVTRARIEESATRVLIAKYKQGNMPEMPNFINRYIADVPTTVSAVINDVQYNTLTLDIARKSIVLCKNDGVLPLNVSTGAGYVGNNFLDRKVHLGSWCGAYENDYIYFATGAGLTKQNVKEGLDLIGATYISSTPYYTNEQMTGIKESSGIWQVGSTTGTWWEDGNSPFGFGPYTGYKTSINAGVLPKFVYNDAEIAQIISDMGSVDTIVATLGWNIPTTHEESDNGLVFGSDSTAVRYRELLLPYQGVELPYDQQKLLEGLLDAGKKVVVVFVGKKIQVIPHRIMSRLNAFIYAGELGSYAGQVIAETLYGLNNPTGRLSFSYPSTSAMYDSPYNCPFRTSAAFNLINIRAVSDKFSYDPAFPFAYGLSYGTAISKHNMTGTVDMNAGVFNASYQLTNNGSTGINELAALYSFDLVTKEFAGRDNAWFLLDFQRIFVDAGATVTASFTVPLKQFAFVPGDLHTQFTKQLMAPNGKYVVMAEHHDFKNVAKQIWDQMSVFAMETEIDFSGVLSAVAKDSTHDFGIQIELPQKIFYNDFSL